MSQVREVIYSQEEYDSSDWPKDNALAFINWFQAKLAEVPAEFRGEAFIELDSRSGYEGEHYVEIEIGYWRPMTQAEIEAKAQEIADNIAHKEAMERAHYEALKRKFEGTNQRTV